MPIPIGASKGSRQGYYVYASEKTSTYTRHINEETFQKIILSCPLIEDMKVENCWGMATVKVINKLHNLKKFLFSNLDHFLQSGTSIEIDHVPSLESIRISYPTNWLDVPKFPNLKDLYLEGLSNLSPVDSFWCNFPCLEKLTLKYCSGNYEEIQISSHSIKHLDLDLDLTKFTKARIDAPNLLSFVYSGNSVPSLSFTKTRSDHQWKSDLNLHGFPMSADDVSLWFFKLNELMVALNQSKISLHLWASSKYHLINDEPLNMKGGFYKPVAVEYLTLVDSSTICPILLNGLFSVYHPRNVEICWFYDDDDVNRDDSEGEDENAKIVWKILMERETHSMQEPYSWLQYVEEVTVLAFYNDEWHPFNGATLLEVPKDYSVKTIRFQLKWLEEAN